MSRILVRSAQDPAVVLPAAESLRHVGGNAGNLLYAHAVYRALSVEGTEVVAPVAVHVGAGPPGARRARVAEQGRVNLAQH